MSYYGQAPGKGNGKGGYGQPYPPQAQYPPAGAESWDDHNTSYDQWGQGPPAPMPYNPPPPGYGGAPPTPGYGMAPPPAKPPAPYGYDPGYGGPRVNPGAGPWGGPAPYPGPAAPGLASEEIVQQQIDDKEREIQALRRQLEELEAQEGGPGPRGGPTPPGPGPGPPPNQPLPSPAPGLNTSAPSWRPPPAGAPMGYAVNGSAAPPAPHPGFAPPPRAWTGQVHVSVSARVPVHVCESACARECQRE